MIDISIIIVSWNQKELLSQCLHSLSDGKICYQKEIIVVDNASTDGALEMVEQQYPSVKVLRNDRNLGFAKANNIGIEESTGRYVCLINSDVIVLEDCIDRMCTYMDDHPTIGVLGPKVVNPDGTLQATCRKFPTLWSSFCRSLALDSLFPKSRFFGRQFMTFWSHDKVRTVDYLSGCFLMVRRDSLNQVGLLDENFFFYAEDKDWCKRFWDAGWQVTYYPHVKAIHHRYASTSLDPIRFYIMEYKANIEYYKKHHSLSTRIGFTLTIFLHQITRILGSTISYIIKPSGRNASVPGIKRSLACLRWLLGGHVS